MNSIINFTDGIFSINTKNTTYQMQVDKYNNLLHLYYGTKTAGNMDYLLWNQDCGFSGNPFYAENNRGYSMDFLPQEFPVRGTGDFRTACFDVKYPDTSWGVQLQYKGYRILDKKYSLPSMPAVYQDGNQKCATLEIELYDDVKNISVKLLYGVIPEIDIITRSVVVENKGHEEFSIEKISSLCLDFFSGDFDLINFYGRHALERFYERSPIEHKALVIQSRRGASSHQQSPFVVIAKKDCTENSGSCWGANFVWSGNFKAEAEKDQFNQTRFVMGLNDELFSYTLKGGESFVAPEIILSYSNKGLNSLSHNFHDCINNNIVRGKFKNKIRPVLINNWEATYFDFNAEKIIALAKEAASLGIEMLVMDDGWFGSRTSDNAGLGDWKVNEEKLGCSLGEMVSRINDLGLKFGIWFEPEMVNMDSDLYRSHPEYALCFPGRKPVRSRNQLVLDYSNPKVVENIYGQMCNVIDSANIEYIKWDFNRSISDVYSACSSNQGEVMYKCVLGVYSLLEKLTAKYPDILFEGCSGGGGRFDAGMMYYTPQIWCSDNTDAIDRTFIQYGSSFGYPVSTMGSHVSICPNHQTGRVTSMHTRGVVAMTGTFGYEINLLAVPEQEKEEIKKQVLDFKKYAKLIQGGFYYRLTNPFENAVAAWSSVGRDRKEFTVSYVVNQTHGYYNRFYLPLAGLDPDLLYREAGTGKVYPGAALMETGLPFHDVWNVHQADILYFKAME